VQIKINTYDLTPEIRGHRPVSNITINGARLFQTVGSLRAEFVQHFDRFNQETVISFDTTREHATAEDAMAFALLHEDLVPRQGLAEFTMQYGSKTIRRWLADAAVTAVASRAAGIVTFHSYELRGGEMLLQTPT
jgi:hypothetical protein